MMETIEERAYNAYPIFTAENVDLVNAARGGYIKGANEQKMIDIDKACEWIKKHNDMCELTNMVSIAEFKKAMEEL